ncbi:hypothetical protein AGR7A_Cc140089 [Agrobacterium deltaense NCPPB 1641]|uniref:Uncharacterized protein n=1 Tax=Agrobacterium deltaense NCPPB 1641 TaxID=1183425 RepID=A0A1S7TK82_9HYPH|nr:hypothetical protein AGR7A_Cc140089 [Agrobacterium deltaense NCPPB 1641]
MATAAATMNSSTMPLIVISQSRGFLCAIIYFGHRLGWFTRLNLWPCRMNFPAIGCFLKDQRRRVRDRSEVDGAGR